MKINSTASWAILLSVIIALLYAGQSIIVPFVVALLIWFVVKKVRDLLDKVEFIERYVPTFVKTLLASILIFTVLVLTGRLLTVNIENLAASFQDYSENVVVIAKQINSTVDVNIEAELKEIVSTDNVSAYLQLLFNSISGLLGNMVMILFYTLFLFIEEGLFRNKMHLLFDSQEKYEQFNGTLKKIEKMLSRYIALKSLVNLSTAFLGYIVLYLVGIDSPFFWAVVIFFFSFIPSIGPIIATTVTACFSLLQFGDFVPCAIILFGIGSIQLVIGNYMEPRLMGNTLNISPLVAVLSLAVWGALWGITGMLLSVPITVAIIIILAQSNSTRPVAVLLSEKGKL